MGLPCDIIPGNYVLSITSTGSEHTGVEFGVLPPGSLAAKDNSDNGIERITRISAHGLPPGITPSHVFNPAMHLDLAIDGDRYSAVEPRFDFDPPVESRDLVGYGSLIGDSLSACHDYLSYQTPMGNRVYAPTSGEVVGLPGDVEGAGLVIISHGGETYSVLGNLGEILVETGQTLDKGEIVGTAGAASTPSGGRIDWAVLQNGYKVDPLRFSTAR